MKYVCRQICRRSGRKKIVATLAAAGSPEERAVRISVPQQRVTG
jgi:hypothetical protein